MKFREIVQNPRRQHCLRVRAHVEQATRDYFREAGFWETRTPLLVPSPGMEPHIRPFQVTGHGHGFTRPVFLPTSPEFAMKRLLAGGLEKIFQIAPAFRDEPVSPIHHPEFTMLEWYRARAPLDALMADVEALFRRWAGKDHFTYQGKEISLGGPWPRRRTRELFQEYLGIDLGRATSADLSHACTGLGLPRNETDTWDDLYFKLWLNQIEPKLPTDRPLFVTHYPESQAALARVEPDADGTRWAQRFEVYVGGFELANAFHELTDPQEQRRRFAADMELRARIYGADFPKTPVDDGFLQALDEGLPESSGIALGLDRAILLLADETDIDYACWLPPFRPESAT
ncbi:MAG: EF-P lysine aminoacylase EpmA [Bacteriovoracia bacterium]